MAALLVGALEAMATNPEIQRVRRVARDAHLASAGADVVALDFSAATVAAAAGSA
jgi:hypothetical protein